MATTTTEKTRLYIAGITIEPKKSSKFPIYVGIFIDRERVHRLPPIAEDQPLHWSLDLPIDVAPQTQVTLQIKTAHRVRVWKGDFGSCILSDHPDWLRYDPAGAQKAIVQKAEKFTISVKFSPPLGMKGQHLIAERAVKVTDNFRDSILGKLGKARSAVEAIVAILEHVEGVHPIAKAALGTLTQVFKHLEEEEHYDESLRDLALGMSNMLSFVETVNQHAKLVQLKETIAQMMQMIEDASRFILDYQSSSALGRSALALVSSKRRQRVDEFIKLFDELRKTFDRACAVQVFQAVAAIEERSLGEQERNLLDKLPLARSAGYDPSQSCMEGTRTKILHDIVEWTRSPSGSTTFLWIHGPAGAGKSSIASSTAMDLEKGKRLGATFFCSRDKPELRDPSLVLPTIAAQLAIAFPPFGKAVAEQLRQDPRHIGGSALQIQYEGLFASPLKQIEESGLLPWSNPLTIVIDALDECGSLEIRTILWTYLLEISSLTKWLKVIITSRPEPDITHLLGANPSWTSFPLSLNDTATHDDILLFIQTRMAEIRLKKNLQPSDWPGEHRTKRLAELAGGLFIWAQTAYKYISNSYIPEERLNQLLSAPSTPGIYSTLDALYSTALTSAFQESDSENLEIFRLVIGTIITALTPLPVQGLTTLLRGRVSEIGIQSVVESFRSVLYEDENDSSIRVCHLSFVDFITDSSRCPQFFVNLRQHHTALATVSLQTMQDRLRFNICDLESSDVFNDQIPDLAKRVSNAIPIPLRYCCVHWMAHLRNSAKDVPLTEVLERFLSGAMVLFWIEALSLLGEIPSAIHGLPLVIAWFQDRKNENSLFITDVHRLILGFKEAITRSSPHLYISALPFAPAQCLISTRFLPSFPHIISLDDRESLWTPCLQTLEGHNYLVSGVSWSLDGRWLVSSSYDHTICVWDAITGAITKRLHGHAAVFTSVSFSPDSRLIASGANDKTIQLWDVETGGLRFPPLLGHNGAINRVIFSPDGKHLASCSSDNTIRIWDVKTGKPALDPFKGHEDVIWSIAYSPDGALIVSCSFDKTARVWDVKTGLLVLRPLTAHTDELYAVDFSPDGQQILTSSRDGSIIIWDSATGAKSLDTLQVDTAVTFAKFSPNGHHILSTSPDSKIRIWDAQKGVELFHQEHSGSIGSACFSPDGQHFVTGSSDRTVRIWELNSLTHSASSESDSWHTNLINSVAVSPHGNFIVSGSKDKTVRVWHADTGTSVCEPLRGHTGSVMAVTFSPDGQFILSASWDQTLRLWSVATWESIIEPFYGHTGAIMCAIFSPSGHSIISASRDRTIRLWSQVTGKEICAPLRGHQSAVIALDISSDGHRIGSGSEDETVKIWDCVSKEKLADLFLPKGSGNVWSIRFSPDSQFIATYSNNSYVRLWDVQKQVVLWNSKVSASSIGRGCCSFSPNGRILFCSSMQSILVLNAKTGSMDRPPFQGHNYRIFAIAISPNGNHLISGSADGTIRVWDIEFQENENHDQLMPDAQKLSSPVDQDGWVRLQNGDPLLWIPTEYRDGLWKRALFSIPPTAQNHPRTLNSSRFRHGKAWTEVQDTGDTT